MVTKDNIYLANNSGRLDWYKRTLQRKAIGFACLGINDARIFFMPGELFVEYQLAAKAKAPDKFVAMVAYGKIQPGDFRKCYSTEKAAYRVGYH